MRITGTNKSIYINAILKLYPVESTDKNGFTCKNHDKAGIVTRRARDIFNEVEAFALSEKWHSLEDVKNYNKTKNNTLSVVGFIRERLLKSNPTLSVLKHHKVLINKIEEFGKIKTFDDLTYENIFDFDVFLRRTINSQLLLYKCHKTLESI